ncbi:MAG: Secretion system C-terminal sorting domain, partial [Bacteroidota bacterium]
PNPTAGNLLINSSNGLIQSIRVFDSKAAIIKTVTNVDNSKSSIDLSDYPQGLYLLEIKTGDKIARVKVIKE